MTRAELLSTTTYKDSAFRVMYRNGLFEGLLSEVKANRFKVLAPADLDERDFRRRVTQTAEHRKAESPLKDPLAQALARKARENFILALEIYNRPSLENRLDAFSQLFCTAWEQLIKAELISASGFESICKPAKQGRRRETISLQKALERVMPNSTDPVRRNLETIAELRHGATHLLMKEIAAPLSRIFQSGVLNFASRYKKKTGVRLLPESSAGLLSLVAEEDNEVAVSALALQQLYGEVTATDILELRKRIEDDIRSTDDRSFSIPLEYRLVLSRARDGGDISLSAAVAGDPQLTVLEKPVLAAKYYPHIQRDAVAEIARRVAPRRFNSHDFLAAVEKEGWKRDRNEFHDHDERFNRHTYSPAALDTLVNRIDGDDGYLGRCRNEYKRRSKK